MKNILTIIYEIMPYLAYLPILIGLLKWKQLNEPFRIFIVILIFGSFWGLISIYLKNHNYLFYVNTLISVSLYGFLFQNLFDEIIHPRIIWASVATVWIIIGAYAIKNGLYQFQTQVLIPFDIFMIVYCGVYLSHCLKIIVKVRTSLFFLTLTLLINFCFVLFVDIISKFLHSYFSNQFFDILWVYIIPLFNLGKIATYCIILLIVKQAHLYFDKIPDF